MLPLPESLAHLPAPSPEASEVSARLEARIRSGVEAAGWLSFAQYMELALYAPGLGYYSAGSAKLGAEGDFVTAPEISPLFARCLARQVGELIGRGIPDVIELGAGSGALAADSLNALAAAGRLPERYRILELSGDLRERQRETIAERAPDFAARVTWLEVLPQDFEAVVVANEVLDAMPTHVIRTRGSEIEELGVDDALAPAWRPAGGELLRSARALALADDYQTEINLAARALTKVLGRRLRRGAFVFVDYGFPAAEYYHPQRAAGTLMCHYRHHAHPDPFVLVGLQDITAHVDFTAIATAGIDAGLSVLGYTTQAQFLINTGITDALSETPASDVRAYAPLAAQAQKLLSPAEMGELFKVLALGKGIDEPLVGFARGDRTHTL